ncbi:MAG: Spi family protease inhibitor [Bacteroidales bacterium]
MKGTQIQFLLILVFTFSIFICNYTYSKEVDHNQARIVALNLCSERAEIPIGNIRISHVVDHLENGETVFYTVVFSEKGFALIAANDIVKPILGYSFESRLG